MRLIALSLLIPLLLGCLARLKTTSKITYTQKDFLSQDLGIGGLALLPVVAPLGLEGYRQSIDDALGKHIEQAVPNIEYLGAEKTLDIFNSLSLTGTYNNMVVAYGKTSVLDKRVLSSIGDALKCQYLLYVVLTDFSKERTFGTSSISGDIQTYHSEGLAANTQLWDTLSGKVVWEAYGHAKRKEGEWTFIKSTGVWEYTDAVARKIVEELFDLPPTRRK